MVKILIDFQNRNIITHTSLDMITLGEIIFRFLKKARSNNLVKGCFFTYYYYPPNGLEPQVKVGIRYNNTKELTNINQQLDKLCKKESNLIKDPGQFKTTPGSDERIPNDVVVDYVICYSFNWVVKIKEDFGSIPSYNDVGNLILNNKDNIEYKILKNSFRDDKFRKLSIIESRTVWERFIHHICNACRIQNNEDSLINLLIANGIEIYR